MRVGVVALQHETNTFIQEPTDLEAFRGGLLATGDAFRDAVEGSNHELAGFFAGLDEAGVTAAALFGARALPYGLVSGDAYAELKRRLLAEISAHLPLDGLLVAPHGAGVSAAAPDLDGDWLQAVRALVGPRVPIVATGDPHANLSARMVDAVDAIIAYRTNPARGSARARPGSGAPACRPAARQGHAPFGGGVSAAGDQHRQAVHR